MVNIKPIIKSFNALLYLLLIFLSFSFSIKKNKQLVVGFYNVENLFDTIDDPHKNDNEFLPTSAKDWNTEKYFDKLNKISRVILAANDWEGIDILGVCEVENSTVLEDLINKTALKNHDYKVLHEDSPDPRGIDVAMIYKSSKMDVLIFEAIPVRFSNNRRTRDIIHVKGKTKTGVIHFYINHWSSRRSGKEASSHKRLRSSQVLINEINRLRTIEKNPNIIILGDFNDGGEDASLLALEDSLHVNNHSKEWSQGTLKYKSKWFTFDHILTDLGKLKSVNSNVFSPDWLFQTDERYKGMKPYRTFSGKSYQGGYSDHFPVVLTIGK